ncbi:hypothetical protein Ahy_A07g034120 [Arachis hypogaea]|uniref:Uncharacterized protein n=1 Tax=Arachis hypogaea TaxID=3818 RepID=A0A445CB95_ARAHY|nr:hypothetical protein Ahy_A07g034120 [Arachis hypogaea]
MREIHLYDILFEEFDRYECLKLQAGYSSPTHQDAIRTDLGLSLAEGPIPLDIGRLATGYGMGSFSYVVGFTHIHSLLLVIVTFWYILGSIKTGNRGREPALMKGGRRTERQWGGGDVAVAQKVAATGGCLSVLEDADKG